MTKILVSVVVPSYNSSQTIEKCLGSLEQQGNLEQFEVIVVDSSTDETASIIKQKFPWVKLYAFSQRKFAGVARNFGISQSVGEIVAFIDSDCFVEPDWINQVIISHQKTELPLIGGAIDNGNPESYVGWAYYFSSFSRWMPQSGEHKRRDLATPCLTAKKWIFETYGVFSETRFCEDTDFSWRIAEAGYSPLLMSNIKVHHINLEEISKLLSRKKTHGKAFAQMRMKKYRFSSAQCMTYSLGAPLLPFLLLLRCAAQVINTKTYRWHFLKALPLTFLSLASWSYGEFLGYFLSKAALGWEE